LEKFSSKKSNLGQSRTHKNVWCAPDCSVMPPVMRTTEDAALENFIYRKQPMMAALLQCRVSNYDVFAFVHVVVVLCTCVCSRSLPYSDFGL
jgi:hypothetical protein